MVCIYCGSETRVTNSRQQKRSNNIWRRRVCNDCTATVTTIESVDLSTALSVLNGKTPQPFSRDTLFISIYESVKHRKDALTIAGQLTDTVIKQLLPQAQAASLTREQIARTTAEVLKRFDSLSGTHYQAFHAV